MEGFPHYSTLTDWFWSRLADTNTEPTHHHPEIHPQEALQQYTDIETQDVSMPFQDEDSWINDFIHDHADLQPMDLPALDTPSLDTQAVDSLGFQIPILDNFDSEKPGPKIQGLEMPGSYMPGTFASALESLEAVAEQNTSEKETMKRLRIRPDQRKVLDIAFGFEAYPDQAARNSLAGAIGLTEKQVRSWFNNARSRRPCQGPKPTSEISVIRDHKSQPKTALPTSFQDSNMENTCQSSNIAPLNSSNSLSSDGHHLWNQLPLTLCTEANLETSSTLTKSNLDQILLKSKKSNESISSLERYMEAPLQQEIGNKFLESIAIQAALLKQDAGSISPRSELSRTPSLYSAKYSASSRGSLASRASWRSIGSNQSGRSHISITSRASRKGRRKHKFSFRNVDSPPVDEKYACVFCEAQFKTRYDWNRHEESAHVAPIEFICEPPGPNYGHLPCDYCKSTHRDTKERDEEHQLLSCCKKDEGERTFTRKDHLLQHIRHVHRAPTFSMMGQTRGSGPGWSRRNRVIGVHDDALFCGFCRPRGHRSHNWASRVAHVGEHFKDGMDLSQWNWDFQRVNKDEPSPTAFNSAVESRLHAELVLYKLDLTRDVLTFPPCQSNEERECVRRVALNLGLVPRTHYLWLCFPRTYEFSAMDLIVTQASRDHMDCLDENCIKIGKYFGSNRNV